MKLRWNWGTGITIFIVFFLLMNVVVIIFAFSQKVDLVTPNYYEKELKYQDEIDAQQKTLDMTEKINVEYQSEALVIQLPNKFSVKELEGIILLYRPSDSSKDIKIALHPDSTGTQLVPTAGLRKGFWKVKINWSSENASYADEKSIFIN